MEPGKGTSEFWLTKAVMVMGALSIVAGALMEGLKSAGLDFGWMPVVLVVAGFLGTVAKALGYTASRRDVKAAELASRGAKEAADLLPLVREAVALLKAPPEAQEPPEGGDPTPIPPLPPPDP